jgi:primase-polymerase (primpol)-like protein
MRSNQQTVACTVETPIELWKKIRALAAETGVSNRNVWLSAVHQYLNHHISEKELSATINEGRNEGARLTLPPDGRLVMPKPKNREA